MASERMEWIEIIEPRTKEHMYANLTTGECVWDAPIGVPVKKTDNNQWWELFDQNTSRFYYYNATSQKTVWHRPTNCDIIPLAKLQTLKQNTEPLDSATQATQTPTSNAKDVVSAMTESSSSPISMNSSSRGGSGRAKAGGVHKLATSETQTSPLSSPRPARRSHHHHHHHHHKHQQQQQSTQQQQQQLPQQQKQVQQSTAKEKESEKARSQSIEGELGRPRRGSQGSWYSHTARNQDSHTSDSGCVSMSRTSLDSPNHAGGQLSAPAAAGLSSGGLSTSTSTPQLKKKPLADANHQLSPAQPPAVLPVKQNSAVLVHRSASNASAHHPPPSKQKSFDVDISVGGGYSLGHENRSSGGGGSGAGGRSGGRSLLPSSLSNNQLSLSRSQSFAQRTQQAQQQQQQQQTNNSREQQQPSEQPVSTMPLTSTLSLDQEEEDSMHEKYFAPGGHLASSTGRRSVESTPQARRKHHHHHHHHHHHRCPKLSPDYANLVPPPPTRSSSSNSSTLAPRESRRAGPGSGGGSSSGREQRAPSKAGSRDDGLSSSDNEPAADDDDDVSSSLSSSPPVPTNPPAPLPPLPLPLDNSTCNESGAVVSKRIANHHQQKSVPASSPIYSNQPAFIPESHILPLQQYILEQAKLSGCYRFGDSLAEEADSSLQSDEEDGGGTNGGGGRGGRGGGGLEYDSDEFADDEAMSNQDDSSSQEYLHDEPSYLDTLEEHYSQAQARLTYIPDGRVSDYVVDSLESRMAASSGYNSNLASLTSHHRTNNHLPPTPGSHCLGGSTVPLETQHASLKRKKDPPAIPPVLYSPIMERAERFLGLSSRRTTPSPPLIYRTPSNPHSLPSSPSPLSATVQLDQLSRVVLNREKKLPSESDIEKYAQDNLNIHKKGIFRKKFSVRDMLSWSKDPIRKPMLVHLDKALKKDATELFKLVQTYMSDRKAKVGMTLNSVALEICSYGYAKPALRDEIYIQICRQTTENPRRESLRRGWELLAICLSFFPPSPKFQAYLDGYMNRHRDPSFDFPEIGKWPIHVQVSHYASVACKRLERGGVGGKRPPRKPTLDEIDQARIQIFRPSMFGSTLEEVMAMQRERFPHCKLPWIQTTLSEEVLRLQGAQTEGIFRVSADVDEVVCLKQAVDRWERPTECTDAHTPASLLKLWYRELYEPLIPDAVYADCIQFHDDPQRVLLIVETLPEINRLVLSYLVRFLQIFARPEVVAQTKMDASNLAMVMAPNCLRCTSHDPRVIFDNARKEMAFMHTLIQCLDTTFMDNMKRIHERD